jgi:putative transposase
VFNVRVAAFCLMPNHYHLLVTTPEANLSRFMRHIDGVYTQRFNRANGYDGQLFRGRYKSVLIDPNHESYILEVVRYIHRNPYKAGLEVAIGLYPWSSWEAYTSRLKKWQWVDSKSILSRFSGKKEEQKAAFLLFSEGETAEEIRHMIDRSQLPLALGSPGFLDWIQETFFDRVDAQLPQSRQISPPREKILKTVQTFYQCSEQALFTGRRGMYNEPRNVTIYLLRQLRGDSLTDIGEIFGLAQYSSVSTVIQNVKHRLHKEPSFNKRITTLINTTQKGQQKT